MPRLLLPLTTFLTPLFPSWPLPMSSGLTLVDVPEAVERQWPGRQHVHVPLARHGHAHQLAPLPQVPQHVQTAHLPASQPATHTQLLTAIANTYAAGYARWPLQPRYQSVMGLRLCGLPTSSPKLSVREDSSE